MIAGFGDQYGRYVLGAALAVFLALSVTTTLVRPPFRDEAWFANPAVSLLVHGHTGSTLLREDSWLPNLPGTVQLTRIDQRTYWIMPLHTALQAPWYWLFGAGLFQMRLLSVVFGAIGLLAVFVYVRTLFGSSRIAGLAALLVAVDHRYVTMAGNGRMDIIAASLGLVALAWYASLRERRLHAAIAGSVAFVCLAALTHPVAAASLLMLGALVARADLGRLRFSHVAVAAAVLAVIASAFLVYAIQDVEAFRHQLGSNSAGRLRGLGRPLLALRGAGGLFFGTFAFGGGIGVVGLLIPVLVVAGVAGAVAWVGKLYRRPTRTILWQLAAAAMYLTFLESQKLHFYLVHITPIAMIALAVVGVTMFDGVSSRRRIVVAAGLLALVAVQLAPTALRFASRSHQRVYTPAVEAVRAAAGSDRSIVGSPEVAFAFGFDRVADDRRLRIARATPGAVVVIAEQDKVYWPWLPEAERNEMAAELASRPLVFRNGEYSVYGPRR